MTAHAEPVAIVTGGSGDIGRAVAAALARTMQVVVTARRAAPLGTVAGARIHAHPSDALDQRSVDTLADWTLERFGRIDVLVNCAASTASVAGSIEDVDVDGLVGDLADMRRRIFAAKAPDGRWEAKVGRGRLQDLELLAQSLALRTGSPARGAMAQLRAQPKPSARELSRRLEDAAVGDGHRRARLTAFHQVVAPPVRQPRRRGLGRRRGRHRRRRGSSAACSERARRAGHGPHPRRA